MIVIILGVVGVISSGILTQLHIKKRAPGLSAEFYADTAGTGIVPKWVSALNLSSWACIVIGIFSVIN